MDNMAQIKEEFEKLKIQREKDVEIRKNEIIEMGFSESEATVEANKNGFLNSETEIRYRNLKNLLFAEIDEKIENEAFKNNIDSREEKLSLDKKEEDLFKRELEWENQKRNEGATLYNKYCSEDNLINNLSSELRQKIDLVNNNVESAIKQKK